MGSTLEDNIPHPHPRVKINICNMKLLQQWRQMTENCLSGQTLLHPKGFQVEVLSQKFLTKRGFESRLLMRCTRNCCSLDVHITWKFLHLSISSSIKVVLTHFTQLSQDWRSHRKLTKEELNWYDSSTFLTRDKKHTKQHFGQSPVYLIPLKQ